MQPQGFSYLSEVGARGQLKLVKKHLDHQSSENLMQLNNLDRHFILIKNLDIRNE